MTILPQKIENTSLDVLRETRILRTTCDGRLRQNKSTAGRVRQRIKNVTLLRIRVFLFAPYFLRLVVVTENMASLNPRFGSERSSVGFSSVAKGCREQPPRGAPWVSGLVGHFVQT